MINKLFKKDYKYIIKNVRYDVAEKIRRKLDKILVFTFKKFGYNIAPENKLVDYYLHEYKSYKEYRDLQIYHNKRKINKVFADRHTLTRVGNTLLNLFNDEDQIKGICHGSRNGFEQNFLNDFSNKIKVIGTDISDTAKDYENSIQWDFHDQNKDWISANSFVYSNSLDQSWQPKVALKTWFDQLKPNGVLILEYTSAQGPDGADKVDPFGVRPKVLPYILTLWFGSQISIEHSVDKKDNGRRLDAWLFVVKKNVKEVILLN